MRLSLIAVVADRISLWKLPVEPGMVGTNPFVLPDSHDGDKMNYRREDLAQRDSRI